MSASFIQGQSANSRKNNDLRSVIQSREDALREVEKLVKHAESLERKYNEKVWLKKFLSSYRWLCFTNTTFWTSSFYDGIVLFRLPEFILALAFNLNLSQIQWGKGKVQAEGCFLVLQELLLVRHCFVMWALFSIFSILYDTCLCFSWILTSLNCPRFRL